MSNHSSVVLGYLLRENTENFCAYFLFFCLCTSMFVWIRINLDYVHEICCNSSLQWRIKKFFMEFKWGLTQSLLVYWHVCLLPGTRTRQFSKTYSEYFLLHCKLKWVPNSLFYQVQMWFILSFIECCWFWSILLFMNCMFKIILIV